MAKDSQIARQRNSGRQGSKSSRRTACTESLVIPNDNVGRKALQRRDNTNSYLRGDWSPGGSRLKSNLYSRQKFGDKVAKRVFSANQIVLKRKLDKDAAAKLQQQFHSLGLTTRISRVAAQEDGILPRRRYAKA